MASNKIPYHAVVDMGSNGIRCSISNLTESTARLLPTLYHTRFSISLHDAQYPDGAEERQPLSAKVINDVIASLKRFKWTCDDFEVQDNNVTIVATEATRTALNADEFLQAIQRSLGWKVTLLGKEEEAVAGAIGIASSLPIVKGLVMDLGGGSLQLSWMDTTNTDWTNKLEENAISLPYGAAALLKRIDAAKSSAQKQAQLKREVSEALQQAIQDLNVDGRQKHGEPLNLYLSGGGFRGWGYLLMALRAPYPIAWVNGFQVTSNEFFAIDRVLELVESETSEMNKPDGDTGNTLALSNEADYDATSKIFRVSKRRLKQLPATMLLVESLESTLPKLNQITFCQGGTQLGTLFGELTPELQNRFADLYALQHAVADFLQPLLDVSRLSRILDGALPTRLPSGVVSNSTMEEFPSIFHRLIQPFVTSMYYHKSLPKDVRPLSALHFTTLGAIGGAIGITHFERAALALMLAERWGGRGDLPPEGKKIWDQMINIVGSQGGWWCRYIGRLGIVVGEIWPAAIKPSESGKSPLYDQQDTAPESDTSKALKERVTICSNFKGGLVKLEIIENFDSILSPFAIKAFEKIGKLGKKKNWVCASGENPWGLKIDVKTCLYK